MGHPHMQTMDESHRLSSVPQARVARYQMEDLLGTTADRPSTSARWVHQAHRCRRQARRTSHRGLRCQHHVLIRG